MGKDTRKLRNPSSNKKSSKKHSKKNRSQDMSTTEEMREIINSESSIHVNNNNANMYNGRNNGAVMFDPNSPTHNQLMQQQMMQQQMMMNQQMMQQPTLSPTMMDPLMVQTMAPVQNQQAFLNAGMPSSMIGDAGLAGLRNLAQTYQGGPQLAQNQAMTDTMAMSPMAMNMGQNPMMQLSQQLGQQMGAMTGGFSNGLKNLSAIGLQLQLNNRLV